MNICMTQRASGIQAALYNHPVVIKMINYLNLRGSQISITRTFQDSVNGPT